MSDEKEEVGGVKGVLIKLGLAGVEEKPEEFDPGPDARPNPNPATPRVATAEALAKLKADIGFDDPASPYRVFEGILGTLKDVITDPALLYKKALQLAEKQAVSSDTVLQEFEEFKTRLTQQGDILEATVMDLTRRKVTPLQKARADAEATLTVKRAEVARLEAELAETDNIIRAEEATLQGIASNFDAARDAIVLELREMERSFRDNLGIKK